MTRLEPVLDQVGVDIGLTWRDKMMTRVCRRKEKPPGSCSVRGDCRRHVGQPMVVDLPLICASQT
jgi:hypothetical protein